VDAQPRRSVTRSDPAAVELAIGIWLVLRPRSRRGLAVSASWALLVWAAGEALGGPAVGGSLLADYPGAALLYAVAALVLFPRKEPRDGPVAAAETASPGRGPGGMADAVDRRSVLHRAAAGRERDQQHAVHADDQRNRGT
jgi:hypothetical protein